MSVLVQRKDWLVTEMNTKLNTALSQVQNIVTTYSDSSLQSPQAGSYLGSIGLDRNWFTVTDGVVSINETTLAAWIASDYVSLYATTSNEILFLSQLTSLATLLSAMKLTTSKKPDFVVYNKLDLLDLGKFFDLDTDNETLIPKVDLFRYMKGGIG